MKLPGFIKTYFGLDRSIYVLFIARIVNRMGDFVQLFLVLYLTTRLGFSEAAAGRFIMITGIMNGAGVLLGGYLSDRINRKTILLISQIVLAAAYMTCGFLPVSMTVPWLIFCSSAFRGATWPVTNAMVTDLTDSKEESSSVGGSDFSASVRKRAFSLLYLGTNFGVAIGPLIAGLLFTNHLNWIFWGDAATTMFAVLAVMVYVPDTKPSKEKIEENRATRKDGERAEEGRFIKVFLQRPVLLAYLFIGTLTSFVYSQHQFALPLRINELFSVEGPRLFGYIMTVNAVVVLLVTAVLTHLTRKVRPIYNIVIACLFYLIGFGMIAFIQSMPMFFVSTMIWTMGEILMVTNSSVFVASHTPITHRGRFNGIATLVRGMGYAFSPWISGLVIESFGIRVMWPITAAVACITALLFWMLGRWDSLRQKV